MKQQIILNLDYPAEYGHLRYLGKKPIHNVFLVSNMRNIYVLKGTDYVPIEERNEYVVTINKNIVTIEWIYPMSCQA